MSESHENPAYESKDAEAEKGPPSSTVQPGVAVVPAAGPVASGFAVPPNVPRGLEYLTQIDQVLIHQKVEVLEVLTGFEMKNRYSIRNSMGQDIYHVQEESETCMRLCCGNARTFVFHIFDNNSQEVMRVRREFECCNCGCPACAGITSCGWELTVEAPPGVVCGYVRQKKQCIRCSYVVMDENRQPQFYFQGPVCICECPCNDVEFKMFSLAGEEIGMLTKQWSGCFKEMFTQADNFGVTFPMDLDVRSKANCIGAIFLIDMHLFQQNNN